MKQSTCVWAAAGAAAGGWLLGHFVTGGHNDPQPGRDQRVVTAIQSFAAAPHSREVPGKKEGAAPGSPASRMAAAFRCTDRAERMKQFLAALEEQTPENTAEFNKVWNDYLAEGRPDVALEGFYNTRAGEMEGARGLARRTGSPADFKALGSINQYMAGAMKTDPDGVRTWFDSLTNETFRERLLGGYMSSLASQDLPAAIDVLAKIDPSFREQSAGAIVGAVREGRGATGLAEWIRATAKVPESTDTPWFPLVFRQAVQQSAVMRQGAHISAGLMEEFAGKPFADPSTLPRIAGKYASIKPVEALEWTTRMEQKMPPSTPGALLAAALSEVSDHDLRTTADWCLSLPPGANRNASLTALIKRTGASDPALKAELEQAAGTATP